MARYQFTPATQIEWLNLNTAAQWLGCTPEKVKSLAQIGKLRYRTSAGLIQVASDSIDRYIEERPVPFATPVQTFTKINGKVYEELSNGKLRRVS